MVAPLPVQKTFANPNHLSIGDKAGLFKTFTPEDVARFAGLSEDFNPLHLDEEFAKTTRFKGTIVHGALTNALFSGLITHLCGQGTIYLSQASKFQAPLMVGTGCTATVEVVHMRSDKPIVKLETVCTAADGKVLAKGEAVVIAPKERVQLTAKL